MKKDTSKFNTSTAVVICNGELPPKSQIQHLIRKTNFIICADGGANNAKALGIRPDMLIGDFDSMTHATQKHYKNIPMIHLADQESTDLEKALDYLVSHGFTSATVLGATGKRTDHTLANFSIMKKYDAKLRLTFSDAHCDFNIIAGSTTLNPPIGQIISLMPLGKCSGITTKGLKYPLKNESLELGVREGASNIVVALPMSVEVKQGSLILFIVRQPVKKTKVKRQNRSNY